MTHLDALDRRITAALLRDGRASWRRIANVLGEPERRVARRGSRLIESGVVLIHAQSNPRNRDSGEATFLRVQCHPRALRAVADHIADDERTLWVSVLAGPAQVVGEYFHAHDELGDIVADLARQGDVTAIDASPELTFYRTVGGWSPGILTEDELRALHAPTDAPPYTGGYVTPDEATRRIIDALSHDGRARLEDVASAVEMSTSTVSRRIESAVALGQVSIRAVVAPALLGFPIETVIAVSAAPSSIEQVGRTIAQQPSARWVIDDGSRLVAQLAHADRDGLHATLSALRADPAITAVDLSPVIVAAKRGTVRYRDGAPVAGSSVTGQ
ncbi:Lrp/AsnC family transcriptional regulator [Microbacterium sp.]|uniref:Lrp/AsnC family transcriptional regulator n=1 Tax=Microbacterium sp. TaxID=51671 RepID=UPI003C7123F2